jgi:hypothetical protein
VFRLSTPLRTRNYELDRVAWLITLATVHGCVIIDRCPAFT